jgi:hypothetical protein
VELMRRLAILSAAVCVAGCVDESFQVGDDGWVLPAPLEDLVPQAQSIATDWDSDAYLWGMGGEFTITDAAGRAYEHSYRFYSRRLEERLDLHFFGGAPWGEASPKWPPPTPLSVNPPGITSAEAVQRVVAYAQSLQIEVPRDLTVRYLGYPVWPEPSGPGVESDSLAWRVDFLEMDTIPAPPGQAVDRTWYSTMTAYLSRDGREIFEIILQKRIYPRFDDPAPPNAP